MSDSTDTASAKILDFGLSSFLGPSQTADDPFGTLTYVAPEVLRKEKYCSKVDVWSLGVITYILLLGGQPFMDDSDAEIARMIMKEEPDYSKSTWHGISVEAKDFVKTAL